MANILIVDDVYTVRLKIELVLRHAGRHTVRSIGSGFEAVEAAQQPYPDAIVLDIVMAGMDGFSTLQQLREAGITCPVIAYTARRERYEGEFCERGFDGFVSKNDDIDTLLSVLRSLIQPGSERMRSVAKPVQLASSKLKEPGPNGRPERFFQTPALAVR
ncbi:MAG: response regulator [Chloroflexaceae bacterium]|nr:response regulator [Chloroflexaceae bacterium]